MIGYVKTRAEIDALIEAESAGWHRRTDARTEEFRNRRRYEEASSLWSEVKAVYMRLQGGSKCAYCERKLEAVEFGKGEQAVDHFRFFRLDDAVGRKNLFLERAWLLLALFPQLEKLRTPGTTEEQATAQSIVEACMRSEMAHANCCRSFVRLYEQSPAEARTLYEAARRFVSSAS